MAVGYNPAQCRTYSLIFGDPLDAGITTRNRDHDNQAQNNWAAENPLSIHQHAMS
jgi:hypothetical protein